MIGVVTVLRITEALTLTGGCFKLKYISSMEIIQKNWFPLAASKNNIDSVHTRNGDVLCVRQASNVLLVRN
jgi:hypothetical protein